MRMMKPQRGIVLPMALVLLVVISIIGVWAIGGSKGSEKMIQSQQNTATAQQAAELALRHCEEIAMAYYDAKKQNEAHTDVRIKEGAGDVLSSPNCTDTASCAKVFWRHKANWGEANPKQLRIVVPAEKVKSDLSGLKHRPQCMIQKIQPASYLITARGFGNDTVLSADESVAKSGAEVWLQSVISPEGG